MQIGRVAVTAALTSVQDTRAVLVGGPGQRGRRTLPGVICSCCGEDRDESTVTSLLCHDEIQVCRICVGWLNGRVGAIDVTPTLPVVDMDEAARFCEAAGFEVNRYDDGFAFVQLAGQSVFDLDLIPDMSPEANHAGCYIITADVGDWHARLVAAGLHVTPIEDMPWGMREFTLTDPSGNNIRVGRSTSDDAEEV
jgi:uncharacterized glyoxalase superfamily protein PhnB